MANRRHWVPNYRSKNLLTLARFILSKARYHGDQVTTTDQIILNLVWLDIEALTKIDNNFNIKNGQVVSEIALLLVQFNQEKKEGVFSEIPYVQTTKEFEKLRSPALMSPRAFLGLEKDPQFQRIYSFAVRERYLTTPFTPSRFIGVGYKDKGSRRIPSKDGSPTWQEVASQNFQSETDRSINEERISGGFQRILKMATANNTYGDQRDNLQILRKMIIQITEYARGTIRNPPNIPWKRKKPKMRYRWQHQCAIRRSESDRKHGIQYTDQSDDRGIKPTAFGAE